MSLRADELASIRATAAAFLPETVDLLVAGGTDTDLGEQRPGYFTRIASCAGRLAAQSTTVPFLAGRPVVTDELELLVPLEAPTASLTGAPVVAYRINGAVYEATAPSDNALTTWASVRRVPVRRSDLSAVHVS